jgi:hypothetical protein
MCHEGGWDLHRLADGRYQATHRDGRTLGPEPHPPGRNRPTRRNRTPGRDRPSGRNRTGNATVRPGKSTDRPPSRPPPQPD